MNWEEVGAVGQVLGSIAVLVTLGYLAIQVRYAKREIQRSTSLARAEATRELALSRASNLQLNSTYVKVGLITPFIDTMTRRAEITAEEASQIFWDQWAWWSSRSQTIQYIDHLMPGERQEFHATTRVSYQSQSIGAIWYETVKPRLNPDAVRYVDNLLAQPD